MGIAHDLVLVGIAHDLKEKKNESLIKSLKLKSAQNSHPFPSDSMYSEKTSGLCPQLLGGDLQASGMFGLVGMSLLVQRLQISV